MTDIALSQMDRATGANTEALQDYVHALLARQQALDLLENTHQQIHDVWGNMHQMLEGTGATFQAAQAVRVARAAQCSQVQNSYRILQKRREDCIASLQHAEYRVHTALMRIVAFKTCPSPRKSVRPARKVSSRQLKKALARN